MTTYPIARYRFCFDVTRTINLPDYAGSMLRGAFGHALRRSACMTQASHCNDCPKSSYCAYTRIFEPTAPQEHLLQKFNNIPSPYVIEPPAWGSRTYLPSERLTFNMVLIGEAIKQLPLIIFAWQSAFRQEVGRGTAELIQVTHCGQQGAQIICDGQRLIEHDATIAFDYQAYQTVTLDIKTPLRIQANGAPIRPSHITPRDLLVAALRRTSLMLEFHANQTQQYDFTSLAEKASEITGRHDLQWRDWTRYSSRQKQSMQLGGVVGKWQLDRVPATITHCLQLGQWLHLGKNATFGLGAYTLSAINSGA